LVPRDNNTYSHIIIVQGQTKANGFQTLRVKLMICDPMNSQQKFQASIQSKSARIKTWAVNEQKRILLSPSFDASSFTSN
jgi:hypothetical protein